MKPETVMYNYAMLKDGVMLRLTDEEVAESWRTAEEAWKAAEESTAGLPWELRHNNTTVSLELRTQAELRRPKVKAVPKFHFEGF